MAWFEPTKGFKNKDLKGEPFNLWEEPSNSAEQNDVNSSLLKLHQMMVKNVDESEINAEKYLFLCHAGGILAGAAILKTINAPDWFEYFVGAALLLFFAGIFCVGLLHMFRIMHNYFVKVSWEKDYQQYVREEINLLKLNTKHYFRARNRDRLKYTALIAFMLYFAAITIIGGSLVSMIFIPFDVNNPNKVNQEKQLKGREFKIISQFKADIDKLKHDINAETKTLIKEHADNQVKFLENEIKSVRDELKESVENTKRRGEIGVRKKEIKQLEIETDKNN